MGARTAAPAGGALHYAEAALPGAAIGLVAGSFGAVTAVLAGLGAGLTGAIAVGMGAPLALLGGVYGVLVGRGVIAPGAIGPTALFWVVGFPAARLAEEAFVAAAVGHGAVLREPLPWFLLFQAMLSLGFAIGFLWLHERLAPRWFRRIASHNPVAAGLAAHYGPPPGRTRRS
ncbi:hypothetical protein [Nocardiopsis composta]|uniref:Uncharacterized protein n=1 Tax=Nocardiopsis composta TaxID=157465 RepID=A0A7W8QT50_9ACTN|nr:hypothetical protein [Nocardiopsis composta]MBB5436054.1 hypothetical protein [Nocardiopsis composta]